jgi:hypothetical protein
MPIAIGHVARAAMDDKACQGVSGINFQNAFPDQVKRVHVQPENLSRRP